MHLASDPVPAVDHGAGELLGQLRVRAIGGDEEIRHGYGLHRCPGARLRIGVRGDHRRVVVARRLTRGVDPADQLVVDRHQPDRKAVRQILDRTGGETPRPEEGVQLVPLQQAGHRVDARGDGVDVPHRVQARRREHPVGDEPYARALLTDAHPLAAQIGRGTHGGAPRHDQLHVVVVQPRTAPQPVRARPRVPLVLRHRVGGGDGEVGLAARHPGEVLLRPLAGPEVYRDLRQITGERTLQEFAVPLVHAGVHARTEREPPARGARRAAAATTAAARTRQPAPWLPGGHGDD